MNDSVVFFVYDCTGRLVHRGRSKKLVDSIRSCFKAHGIETVLAFGMSV